MNIRIQTKSQASTKSSTISPVHSLVHRSFTYQRGFAPVARWKAEQCPEIEVRHQVPARIQTQLTIGRPGDKYEQEADRVADQVMQMPESVDKQRQPYAPLNQQPSIQRFCPECEEGVQRQSIEEEEKEEEEEGGGESIQAKHDGAHSSQVTPNIQAQIPSMRGDGQPLPESTRAFFEPRFGYDFGHVRIHADVHAAKNARVLSARAYTTGKHVVFGSGQFEPHTKGGKTLLAHELTHVVQQQGMTRLKRRKTNTGF